VPYLGEVRMFAGSFAPQGWALCDGQILSVASNTALFNVLGARFGGDGVTTFALPDLRGRAPLGPGQGPGLSARQLAEAGGVEVVALAAQQMPSHAHTARASTANGSSDSPVNGVSARMPSAIPQYGTSANVDLHASAVAATGGSQPHNNLQPYIAIGYIIAIQGTAP